jgi:hypothetical protein
MDYLLSCSLEAARRSVLYIITGFINWLESIEKSFSNDV